MPTDPVNKSSVINPLQVGKPGNAKGAAKARGDEGNDQTQKSKTSGNFSVALSPEARELAKASAKAKQIASDTPVVREDRVAALKKQIAEGTYKVDSGKIADGILTEAIKERLAELEER